MFIKVRTSSVKSNVFEWRNASFESSERPLQAIHMNCHFLIGFNLASENYPLVWHSI